MNKIVYLLITAVILTACTEETTSTVVEPEPQFAYMQEVTIYKGFLRGQTGKIISYETCNKDTPKAYVCYTIKLNTEPAEGKSDTWQNIPETDLTP